MKAAIWVFAGFALQAIGADKPRVFITESGASQFSGEAEVPQGKGSMAFTAGTSPQNIEVLKAFSKQCPQVLITSNRDKADYVIRFDHDEINPTTAFVKGNKVAVFNRSEDLIYTTSTRLLGPAVKSACLAISGHR